MSDNNACFLKLSATLESIETFQDWSQEQAKALGMSPGQLGKLRLVLEEALVNIMNYAYDKDKPDSEQAMAVKLLPEEEGICFVIQDWGKAFNPLEIPPPSLEKELDERQVGGLGVFFIREMADRMDYQRVEDANCFQVWLNY